jgi:chromosome segregation ATPase
MPIKIVDSMKSKIEHFRQSVSKKNENIAEQYNDIQLEIQTIKSTIITQADHEKAISEQNIDTQNKINNLNTQISELKGYIDEHIAKISNSISEFKSNVNDTINKQSTDYNDSLKKINNILEQLKATPLEQNAIGNALNSIKNIFGS